LSPSHLGGVVRDFRVLRYEPDAKTRLVHGRRTRGVQEPGAPEQHGALAAVGRHLGDGQLVGHQTLYGAVDLTAARFAVAARNADAKVRNCCSRKRKRNATVAVGIRREIRKGRGFSGNREAFCRVLRYYSRYDNPRLDEYTWTSTSLVVKRRFFRFKFLRRKRFSEIEYLI